MGLLSRLGVGGLRPFEKRGLEMMGQRTAADEAHRVFQGGMFGERQSPNAAALQGVVQRLQQRGPEYASGGIDSLKSLLFYNVPGLRNNPRLQSAQSIEELAKVLDDAGADPSQWASRMGL